MSFFDELKRRNVFKVGVAYVILAWLTAQVTELALDSFTAPDWVMKSVLFLLLVGFPFALIFAWAFELTPEGIKKEKDVVRSESVTHVTGRKLDFVIIAVLAIAVAYFVAEKSFLSDDLAPETQAGASIAVLPFVNMSSDADQEYFSDGITEEILNTLAAIDQLQVAGRTSSFRFKNKTDLDFATIGEMLGVNNILEGSVRTAGNRVRITAQLIVSETGFHLWSETYDRDLTDIFAIQEEIANAIGAALQVELGLEVAKSLDRRRTDNPAAYQWYLRGVQLRGTDAVKNYVLAEEAFQKAITLDPSYVAPYVGYARAKLGRIRWGAGSANDLLKEAQQALDIAAALDPDYSDRYLALARLKYFMSDPVGEKAALARARELNPDDPEVQLYWASNLAYTTGKFDEAVVEFRRYLEREPLDFANALEYSYLLANTGQLAAAEAEFERIITLDPGNSAAMKSLGDHYQYFMNRIAKGLHWREQGFSLDPENLVYPQLAVRAYLDLGDAVYAERWLKIAIDLDGQSIFSATAEYFLARNRNDELRAAAASRRIASVAQVNIDGWNYVPDLAWLRALQVQDPDLALSVYKTLAPGLFAEQPMVDSKNHAAAIGLAILYQQSGDAAHARDLLERSLAAAELSGETYVLHTARTAIYALKEDIPNALRVLRTNIDENWRWDWWMLEQDPIYDVLWDEPEFQAMMAEIRADMAIQLEEVREMQWNGDIVSFPDVARSTSRQ